MSLVTDVGCCEGGVRQLHHGINGVVHCAGVEDRDEVRMVRAPVRFPNVPVLVQFFKLRSRPAPFTSVKNPITTNFPPAFCLSAVQSNGWKPWMKILSFWAALFRRSRNHQSVKSLR